MGFFFLNFLFCTGACQVVLVIKDPPASAGDIRDVGLIPGSGRSPEAPRFSILAWRSHGHRSLVDSGPQG